MSIGALIGAVIKAVGGALIFCSFVLLIYMTYKRNKSKREDSPEIHEVDPYMSDPLPAISL